MTLEELCDLGFELAQKTILNTKEQFLTNFTLVKEDEGTDIIVTPWKNDEEKSGFVREVGLHIIKEKTPVKYYAMFTEAWMSHYKHANSPRRADQPRNDPLRQEAILCLGSDGKEHLFRSWKIERDSEGVCVSLTASNSPGQFDSWMTDALDKAMRLQKAKQEVIAQFKSRTTIDHDAMNAMIEDLVKKMEK